MISRPCKLLIIGGYGNFGGRLARLLADEPRLTVTIGGRSLHKAESFVAGLSGPAEFTAVAFDRDGDVSAQIRTISPDIVVDTSGPWQAYGPDPYRVARAAIDNNAHYLDLADGREFVCNISELDAVARERGVFALAGVSTCPVLSTAAARHLTADLKEIDSVTGGIAPSPFAGMGRSVVEAIAGYAGKPLIIWQDGRQHRDHTFVSTRRFTIRPPGHTPLPPMTFSLIDVPDLDLLSELHVPVRTVWFGVATMPAIYHAFLRLLARGVKAGIIPTLRPLAPLMHYVMNHFNWGEHRGGMFIEVCGKDEDGEPVRRSWNLVAEGDVGPNVPILAASIIVRRCLQIRIPEPGARAAKDVLALLDYEPMFDQLGIVTGERRTDTSASQPLFRKVLGESWSRLPGQIRELHGESAATSFAGKASVMRGQSLLSKLTGRIIGFPPESPDMSVRVNINPLAGAEQWQRDFDGHRFSSEHSAGEGRLSGLMCERFGAVKIAMALVVEESTLRYVPRRWTFLGVPMPKWLMPTGQMQESVADGKFHFHVKAKMPVIGHLVTYEGWLEAER